MVIPFQTSIECFPLQSKQNYETKNLYLQNVYLFKLIPPATLCSSHELFTLAIKLSERFNIFFRKIVKEVTLTVFQKVEYEFVASKDILLVHYNVKVGNLFKRLAFEIVFNTPLWALGYRFSENPYTEREVGSIYEFTVRLISSLLIYGI